MARMRMIGAAVVVTLAVVGSAGAAASTRSPDTNPVPAKVTKMKSKKPLAPAGSENVGDKATGDPETYWTPERMRNAKPAPMGEPGGATPTNPSMQGSTSGGSPPQVGAKAKVKKSKTSSAGPGSGNVGHQATGDPETYWTPERMRNAKPAPMGEPGGATPTNPPVLGSTSPGSAPSD